jgi:hypothetical protein
MLHEDSNPVVLHGFGVTCTEYLLRGIGMSCFATYQWNDKSNIITELNRDQMDGILHYLAQVTGEGVKPAVRIPLTASYWMGVRTNAASSNMDNYPNLSAQYRTMISKMVDEFTQAGAVSILDLHWNDDDTEQQEMAVKNSASNAIDFWGDISKEFADNANVFYELYNEPHIDSQDTFIHGNSQYAGMLEMEAAVRSNAPDAVLVIAGGKSWAYDSDTLVALDKELKHQNAMWNFHPYMGANQAGDDRKAAAGFQTMVEAVQSGTNKPVIITEFGQFCCDTDGSCYKYPGTWNGVKMGYDEAILTISEDKNVSWTPWSWRPTNSGNYEGH